MKVKYAIFGVILVVAIIFGYQGVSSLMTLSRINSEIDEYSNTIDNSLKESESMINVKELEGVVKSLKGFSSVECVFDMNSDLSVNDKIGIEDVANLEGVHLLEVYVATENMNETVASLKSSNLLVSGIYVSDNLMIRLYVKGE